MFERLADFLHGSASVGGTCPIVCYIFNTHMMYFIRIFCQFLSASLLPITAWLKAQLVTPDKQLACIVLPRIFLHLQSPCFFLCWEFNYPGCCCMMLSWHLVTDSLSQLLVWQRSINSTIVSAFLQLCSVLDLGHRTPLAISGRMRCWLKNEIIRLIVRRHQKCNNSY